MYKLLSVNQFLPILNTYQKMTCGSFELPVIFAKIVHLIVLIMEIGVPIIIIVLGMIDVTKAVMAQKDDEIKKGQQTLFKRIGVGAIIFLVFFIVQMLINFVAPINDNRSTWQCINCFINGKC